MNRHLIPLLVFLVQVCLLVPVAPAQVSEGKVKAAIVMAIGRFIEWPQKTRPEKDEGTFYLGLLPQSEYAADFANLNGKTLNNRIVKVIQVRASMPRENLQRCDLIFGPDIREFKLIQKKLESAATLSIADAEASKQPHYTGVTLLKKDNRLVFHLSLPILKKTGFRPTAQLLKIADKVHM